MQESLWQEALILPLFQSNPLRRPVLQQLKRPVPDSPREVDELRFDTSHLLTNHCTHTKPNLTMEEHRAIKQLREDQSRVILTADKGVAMVIMDKQDYMDKVLNLLSDTSTHRILNKDPINKLKKKLIQTLKDIKQTGELSDQSYRKMYATSAVPPKFYGIPKIHKVGIPLRPIVASRGSITYGVAKELAYIIRPLVGQSPHHLKTHNTLSNTYKKQGWNQVRWWLHMMSKSFSPQCQWILPYTKYNKNYHSIPHYTKGPACPSKTSSHYWSSALKTDTSSSQVSIMNRYKVLPWVLPLAPLFPTCLWKHLRSRPLALPHNPHLWLRFVDDTFVINKAEHSQQLLQFKRTCNTKGIQVH